MNYPRQGTIYRLLAAAAPSEPTISQIQLGDLGIGPHPVGVTTSPKVEAKSYNSRRFSTKGFDSCVIRDTRQMTSSGLCAGGVAALGIAG